MILIETIIIALAIYFGMDAIGDGLHNVAVGIEQAAIRLAEALEEPFAELDEEDED
ncbi:hypothetical protein [Bradyrhizobium sp. HKCCYLS20291]|uniref:hypothetical protein n=1 Tax=Bradyrhizobium sp. HKCCYLS20291 TaxID=3420766 RepID=UPI003EBE8AD6